MESRPESAEAFAFEAAQRTVNETVRKLPSGQWQQFGEEVAVAIVPGDRPEDDVVVVRAGEDVPPYVFTPTAPEWSDKDPKVTVRAAADMLAKAGDRPVVVTHQPLDLARIAPLAAVAPEDTVAPPILQLSVADSAYQVRMLTIEGTTIVAIGDKNGNTLGLQQVARYPGEQAGIEMMGGTSDNG